MSTFFLALITFFLLLFHNIFFIRSSNHYVIPTQLSLNRWLDADKETATQHNVKFIWLLDMHDNCLLLYTTISFLIVLKGQSLKPRGCRIQLVKQIPCSYYNQHFTKLTFSVNKPQQTQEQLSLCPLLFSSFHFYWKSPTPFSTIISQLFSNLEQNGYIIKIDNWILSNYNWHLTINGDVFTRLGINFFKTIKTSPHGNSEEEENVFNRQGINFFYDHSNLKEEEEEEERRMLACHCNLPDTRRPNMIYTYIHSKRATNISDYRWKRWLRKWLKS